MKTYIFPCSLIALNVGAAIMYATEGDWRKVVYWIAAALAVHTYETKQRKTIFAVMAS